MRGERGEEGEHGGVECGERGEDTRLGMGLLALVWLFPLNNISARGSVGVPGRVGTWSWGELMSAVCSWKC